MYFCVKPYFEGKMGTYLLNIGITVGMGIDESDEMQVSLYPNPVRETLNVAGCGNAKEIRLFNALGVMMKHFNTEGKDNLQVPMTDLPEGVYMLQIIQGNHTITRKIVKTN